MLVTLYKVTCHDLYGPWVFCFRFVYSTTSWWRGTVVERRSLAGELSLSCARPAADG